MRMFSMTYIWAGKAAEISINIQTRACGLVLQILLQGPIFSGFDFFFTASTQLEPPDAFSL